jgi:uncharacterized protein (DUF488 family)
MDRGDGDARRDTLGRRVPRARRARGAVSATAPTVWSLGHSTLALEQLLALLAANRIERLVDVRRYPRSRRHPHFSRGALELALPRAGVQYVHLEALGGHREARLDSPHRALPLGPFRGYADHMASADFRAGLSHLVELARERRTAILCAEARWKDCHRRILCDRLVADGITVVHVRTNTPDEVHRISAEAQLDGGALVYRGAQRGLFD